MSMPTTATPPAPASTNRQLAVSARGLAHAYGDRPALVDLTLDIFAGELFAVLGPNGGGKTTLFRLLSTLLPLQAGQASLLGHDLARQTSAIRRSIGVVFQSPSLDRKLTARENIRLQAALYGLKGPELRSRLEALLIQFDISDRADEWTERLSGGLRRRVELAKGLIHAPRLLLLDEPSTGLDPASRSDLWRYLRQLREQAGTTVVLTTHFLDEAERADRVAILDAGRLVALGTPGELRAAVGGDTLMIDADEPAELASAIQARFALPARVVGESVRLELADGHTWVSRIVEAFPGRIRGIRVGQPTLEDVFIARTGRRFWQTAANNQVV